MTHRGSAQASRAGAAGMAAGAGLALIALVAGPRGAKIRQTLGVASPNTRLMLEPQAAMDISSADRSLLQTLFRNYRPSYY